MSKTVMDTGLVSLGLVNASLDTKEFIANSKTVKILPVHLMESASALNVSVILVGRETNVLSFLWGQNPIIRLVTPNVVNTESV